MKKRVDVASMVSNIVYTPTGIAYGWIVVHFVVAGVVLYLLGLFVSYRTGAFERFGSWPTSSKVAFYMGVPYIALALYFSTRTTTYSMAIPAIIYALVCIVGGLALRTLNAES
jgi:hypothetical protein